MKNLKVTLHLAEHSPVILNRFTTIDSILLSAYYGYMQKNGKRLEYDPDHNTVDFIHKENGVFSGSIWYIDRTENIYLDFHKIVKKVEYRKIFDAIGAKTASNAMFKGALIEEEVMLVKKIHFYVRGKKEHIEALLHNEVKSIGQKQRLGFGEVVDVDVDVIDEDKGFMLNERTPSKPLPVYDFNVQSKKIAYFRRMPPYWEKQGREACYLPTTALYEYMDNTDSNKYSVAKDLDYTCNVDFIYETAKKMKEETFQEVKITTKAKKQETFEYENSDTPVVCAFTGQLKTEGMHSDLKSFMWKWKSSFGDFYYMKNNNFISKEALWCIDNMGEIGYSLVSEGDKKWNYLQGTKAEEGKRINQYILDHKMFKPPFSINLKDTANAQHVSFKGEVSVSTAFYFVQYGNTTLQIDVQMLNEAIKDIAKITEEYKNITKTHLCGNFKQNSLHPTVKSSADKEKHEIIVKEFHKKYNSDLRNYLNVVAT